MRFNFTAISVVFGHINRENEPRNFFVNFASGELPKCVLTSGTQLRFWTHKSLKCTQNFFCITCKRRASKMRLNFAAKFFVFRRKNRENAPRTFFKLASGEFLNCVWTFFHRLLLYIHHVTCKRLNRENMSRTSLKKLRKFVLWNFFQWKKLRPILQVPIFKIFVGWRPEKVPAFFGSEGTLLKPEIYINFQSKSWRFLSQTIREWYACLRVCLDQACTTFSLIPDCITFIFMNYGRPEL